MKEKTDEEKIRLNGDGKVTKEDILKVEVY